MSDLATSSFEVTKWEEVPYHETKTGPKLSRAVVTKVFRGDLDGTSSAELLMCLSDPSNPEAGAGYVANELIDGTLSQRSGTFVLQHGGVMKGPGLRKTFGHVVPGSGTGELEGLTGDAVFAVDAGGKHSVTLTYDFAAT